MTIPSLKATPTSMASSVLRRVHFGGSRPTSFKYAGELQAMLTSALLASKAHQNRPSHDKDIPVPLLSTPDPTIFTMEFEPVYTLGRREKEKLTYKEKQKLMYHGAQVFETPRGGQITFHGPGQLTAYVILDLIRYKLTPRWYVAMLEDVMISTCTHYGIKAFKTKHTGVWTSRTDKIGAVGVHMRRNITSYGIALNINTDMRWFTEIVPCGLRGMNATSFEKEGVSGRTVSEVGCVFCEQIAKRIGCDEVKSTKESELIDWLNGREALIRRNTRAAGF